YSRSCGHFKSILAMYVSRIFGHVSRHEIHKALQFKDPLPRTPVKMYLLVSKSGLGGEGGRMAVTVQMQFESSVTALYEDAFIGSSIENGTTIIQFDLRKLDFQRILETTSTICWCKAPYAVEVHELSTFHNPIKYRFILAQGSYLNDQHQRVYFTPEIK